MGDEELLDPESSIRESPESDQMNQTQDDSDHHDTSDRNETNQDDESMDHKIDIYGLKLLGSFRFWYLWILFFVSTGSGLMCINAVCDIQSSTIIIRR